MTAGKCLSAFGAAALGLGLLASACSPGKVTVSGNGDGGPSDGSSADSSDRSLHGGGQGTPGGGHGGGSGSTLKIFFERVLTDEGLPQSVIAISYLPQGATSGSAPFGAPLRVPQAFGPNPIFVPGADRVVYLRSTGIGADSLVSTQLASMRTQPIFAFSRPVAGFALSPSRSMVAWAGRDGTLSVATLDQGNAVSRAIEVPGYRARSVRFNATGTRLLMRTDADAFVFAPAGNGGAEWQQEAVYRGVTAAEFSPEGDRLAVVGHDDRLLRIVRPGHDGEESLGALESSEIYDLTWNGSQGFTYWTRLRSQQQEIRAVAVAKATGAAASERTLARLSVPAGIHAGVVCPAWSSDSATLYFSDYIDGEFVIERLAGAADPAKAGHPAIFAQPPATDEGFVCPRSE